MIIQCTNLHFLANLHFLNNVIIDKIKVLLSQTYVTVADFGYHVEILWLYCSQIF